MAKDCSFIPAISRGIPLDHPIPQTLFQLLKRRPPSLSELKRIHSRVVVFGVWSHASLTTSLVNRYLSAGDLGTARKLFDGYPSLSPPPTLVWNLLIKAYSRLRNSRETISLFAKMLGSASGVKVSPDDYTFTSVVASCSSDQGPSDHGEIVHGLAVKNGFESDLFVGNSLVNMYAVFGRTREARKLFDEMPERDAFSWTGLLRGHVKSGEIGKARQVFDEMPKRNEVSWAVMISGLVGLDRYVEALRFFYDMLSDEAKIRPNEAVLVSVLCASANLGALEQGIRIHSYVDSNRFVFSDNIIAALINMYAKCGQIDRAREVFDRASTRDVSVYTSMITGLSIHGLGREALRVFSRMLDKNVTPNEITVLGVLNGCSHSGLVTEGTSVFSEMKSKWGIVPTIEHYGSHVDLLGRAGLLGRAFEVLETMPMRPDIAAWRALLSACRIHRDVKLGEHIAERIERLDRVEGKILLSNLNASLGEWERVSELRKAACERRNRSGLGRSWIEIDGAVHEFRADDRSHLMIDEIREKLLTILVYD